MDIENIIQSKSKEEKESINNMLQSKQLKIESFSMENLIDSLSVGKVNLNDYILYCSKLKDISVSNINETIIFAKSQKIDNIINFFNNSNTFTSYTFKDNLITFDSLKKIKKLQFNIENFNYQLPLEFKIKVYCSDKTIIEKDIIPFNYNGLFNEFFIPSSKEISLFEISNKKNILVYSCIYNDKTFQIGNELSFTKDKDYSFDKDNRIILNNKFIKNENILIKYQPSTEAFELSINKMVSKVELIIKNDLLKVSNQLEKSIEVFLYD